MKKINTGKVIGLSIYYTVKLLIIGVLIWMIANAIMHPSVSGTIIVLFLTSGYTYLQVTQIENEEIRKKIGKVIKGICITSMFIIAGFLLYHLLKFLFLAPFSTSNLALDLDIFVVKSWFVKLIIAILDIFLILALINYISRMRKV